MSELMLDVGQANEIKLAARKAGATNADLKALCKDGMFDAILPVLRGRAKVVVNSILTFLRAVQISAQAATTTSKEYFEEARVAWISDNFQNQFLGLEVAESPEADLVVSRLEEDTLDVPILAELGDKAEISPSQFRAFLAANRGSTEYFIFYLRGKNGELWAVRARWHAGYGGWRVSAHSVSRPDGWYTGSLVLSRN